MRRPARGPGPGATAAGALLGCGKSGKQAEPTRERGGASQPSSTKQPQRIARVFARLPASTGLQKGRSSVGGSIYWAAEQSASAAGSPCLTGNRLGNGDAERPVTVSRLPVPREKALGDTATSFPKE